MELTLIKFFAPKCSPCKLLDPILDDIQTEFPKVKIERIDATKNQEKAAQYAVTSLPTMVLKNGRLLWVYKGYRPNVASEIRAAIRNNLN